MCWRHRLDTNAMNDEHYEMNPRWRHGLASLIMVGTVLVPSRVRAWTFNEHTRATREAVSSGSTHPAAFPDISDLVLVPLLDRSQASALARLWDLARKSTKTRAVALCPDVDHDALAVNTKACISFASLAALAADHTCSDAEPGPGSGSGTEADATSEAGAEADFRASTQAGGRAERDIGGGAATDAKRCARPG